MIKAITYLARGIVVSLIIVGMLVLAAVMMIFGKDSGR
jgi:hypothetical protein